MTDQPSHQPATGGPKKQPYGPGILMVFGFGLLIAAAYVICALYLLGEADTFRQENKEWKIHFNWAGAAAATAAAVYAFVLAAKRSKGAAAGSSPAAPEKPESPPAPPEGGGDAGPADAEDNAEPPS